MMPLFQRMSLQQRMDLLNPEPLSKPVSAKSIRMHNNTLIGVHIYAPSQSSRKAESFTGKSPSTDISDGIQVCHEYLDCIPITKNEFQALVEAVDMVNPRFDDMVEGLIRMRW
jgi:hypothetical protein